MKRILFLALLCSALIPSLGQGKKSVSILGDSYSTFQGFIEPDSNFTWYQKNWKMTDVTKVEETWWHLLISQMNGKLCVNNSFSGSTICNTGYNKEDCRYRSFIARMKNLGNPDIIFIFGGTNDCWAKSPIGEFKYDNWEDSELYSFRPAMAYMLSWMKKRYIGVDIYFILNSELTNDINSSVETICKYYDVPVIKLHDIEKKSSHPSIKGMEQIAEQIKKACKL